ncbi:hypothetical protein HHL16_18260 [Pseudoflavitalea sp. G-6-1-2]|uniref:DUF6263 family protein n=1 Tax=Pseudoflavitalea sp. G-6-1-2 TaxID=2728841 RepID=UPI00146AFF03|nr:DUF6263 family protein [Pseudoflavitalea sp. G-6-1-2]NML22835.1 hypothetical protein [Pseudoflavitalea sp. G-6-1-2]
MKPLSCIAAIPLLLILLIAGSCKQEAVSLRFIPENNARYELEYELSGVGTKESRPFNQTKRVVLDLTVKPDSGGTDIKATYKRFQFSLVSPTDSSYTDTDHPIADSMAMRNPKLLAPWVWQGVNGLSFNFRIGSSGRIDTMDTFLPLLTNLAMKVLHQPDSSVTGNELYSQVWNTGSQQFSSASAKAMLQAVFPEYPARELKKGDTLGRTYQYYDRYPITMVQVIKVAEVDEATVTFLIGGSGFTTATIEGDLKVEQQGKIIVDRSTGVLLSAYIENLVRGKEYTTSIDNKSVIRANCKKILPR